MVPTDRRTVSPDRLRSQPRPMWCRPARSSPRRSSPASAPTCPARSPPRSRKLSTTAQPAQFLLIPQGSRLIGQYDSQVAFGQSRVLLVWTRLILPNGKLHRAGAPARRRYRRLCRPRRRGRLPLGQVSQGGGALDLARRRRRGRNQQTARMTSSRPSAGRSQQHQPDRPADRPTPAQHPADAHHSAGFSGARHRQPRSGIWRHTDEGSAP